MTEHIQFLSWQRPNIYDLLDPNQKEEGRLTKTITITLRDRDSGQEKTEAISFAIMGPADVKGIRADAASRLLPPHGTNDAEETKLVGIEFSDRELPWRYTPELEEGDQVRPWLVLVVGEPDLEISLHNGQVRLAPELLNHYALSESWKWAHVQQSENGGYACARILSPRDLDAKKDYIAVLVPAFTPDSLDSWALPAQNAVELPAYLHWRFTTTEAGDFKTLASDLKPRRGGPNLGRAPIRYRTDTQDIELSIRGALAPVGSEEAALPSAASDHLAAAILPGFDDRGRPIVGLPHYGEEWNSDALTTTWGNQLNTDPRHRGIAGVGVDTAIEQQEEIVEEAVKQAGDLEIAAQWLRHLSMGLLASRSLWHRRMPADSSARLLLAAGALDRLITPDGSVLSLISGPERPISRALFSSAARRMTRPGTAMSASARKGALNDKNLLSAVNRCPPSPKVEDFLAPHAETAQNALGLPDLHHIMKIVMEKSELPASAIFDDPYDINWRGLSASTRESFKHKLEQWRTKFPQDSSSLPLLDILQLLHSFSGKPSTQKDVIKFLEDGHSTDSTDEKDILDLIRFIFPVQEAKPCRPVDLDGLGKYVSEAIDPNSDNALALSLVSDRIAGIDTDPLYPPEICIGLDFPAWRILRDANPDWLVPGGGELKEGDVVGLQTNPDFMDAFLVGLNRQIIYECRWRNLPIARGCTPVKMLWERTNPATGEHVDEIHGIHAWTNPSQLGDEQHRTPAAAGIDTVLLFRTSLFRRYPNTLIYAVPAMLDAGEPDWELPPQGNTGSRYPVFQGNLGADMVFIGFDMTPDEARNHWIVLEEPPSGYEFRSQQNLENEGDPMAAEARNAQSSAEFAKATLNQPTKVLIRGSSLLNP